MENHDGLAMTLIRRIFSVSQYRTLAERERATLIYVLLLIMISFFLFYGFFSVDWAIPGQNRDGTLVEALSHRPITWVYFFVPLVIAVTSLIAVRVGRMRWVLWAPPAMLYLLACLPTIIGNNGFDTPTAVLTLMMFILIAGLVGNEPGIVSGLLIAALSLVIQSGDLRANEVFVILLELLGVAVVAYLYVRFATINRNQGESEASEERLKLAEITSRITRAAAQRSPMQEVLDLAIRMILEKYPQFYHAQVFLIDDNGIQARLIASSGNAGRALLAREHSLAVGSLSVIGQVTLRGVPVIEEAGTPTTMHRFNALLPDTRVEAAFPLRTENDIIGALDLQSHLNYVFNETDKSAFQALADSLSLVIDNVRQFESARQRIQENQRLADQARNALREIERLNKRLIGRAWGDYLRGLARQSGLNVDFEQDTIEADQRWTAALADAAQSGQLVQSKNIVAMPLRVRGQVIGAMEFELPDGVEFEAEDIELVREISDCFGLTAENMRLVEESQRLARREAMINEVSSRVQVANNVEATMTEVARSLRDVLQAQRVVIRMGTNNRQSKEAQS